MRYSAHLFLFLTLLSWMAVVRSQNCQLQVPANPLTAQGLATPYVLTGCNQLDFANQGAFVEAAILDPATGNIQIYAPLVINAGMTPAENSTGAATASAGTATSISASASSGTGAGATATSATGASDVASSSITSASGGTDAGATTTSAAGASGVASSSSASASATPTNVARQAAAAAGFYIPPIVPTLPNNAVVGIWFGSNAASVTLTGNTGGCVNGADNSVFGQFAYCNAPAWFTAAKAAVSQGLIQLPAPGTGSGGQACPTTRDFRVVDQDQSDNVVTTYLLIGGNTLAQNSPANNQANPNAEVLSNASDNALITQFIDPALGCAPYQNTCTTCPTGKSSALATDELVANFFPPAGGPALVPLNDPMVLINGQQSLQKVNLYREGAGQPHADDKNASGLAYCQQFAQSGIFINNNQQLFTNAGSPAANAANNLFTFLAMRFSASFAPAPGLGCTMLLNVANPVSLTMDGNGVVTAATINTQLLQQVLGGVTGNATTAASASSASATASTAGSSVPASPIPTSSASAAATAASSTTAQATGPAPIGSPTPSQTGVLLHLTPVSSSTPSVAPPTSDAAGNATANVSATSAAACTGAATVTVTVTAMGCPAQGSSTASALPATSCGGWNGGGGQGENQWKRFHHSAADRMHRKSRMASFH